MDIGVTSRPAAPRAPPLSTRSVPPLEVSPRMTTPWRNSEHPTALRATIVLSVIASLILMLVLASNAAAVRGPRGAVGPAGPQGPIGPQGPQGPVGVTGAVGIQGI